MIARSGFCRRGALARLDGLPARQVNRSSAGRSSSISSGPDLHSLRSAQVRVPFAPEMTA